MAAWHRNDWRGAGDVSMKRARVVIPWFGLVVCWLNNGWCGGAGGTFLMVSIGGKCVV